MKWPAAIAAGAVLCLGLVCDSPILNNRAQAQQAPLVERKITVLSPMGTPPPIPLKPMAPRLDTLKGKTIYVVDQGYLGSDNLLKEMVAWFGTNMPETNVVFKRLARGFGSEDTALWAEIKEKGDAMIMGTGH